MTVRKAASAGMFGVLVAAAALAGPAFACSPNASIKSRQTNGEGDSEVPVTGQTFEPPGKGGPVEIRWGGQFGPLLTQAVGPDFDVVVTIPPDAAPGYYYIVAVQYATASRSVTGKSAIVYEVTAPTGGQPPAVTGSGDPTTNPTVTGSDSAPILTEPDSPPTLTGSDSGPTLTGSDSAPTWTGSDSAPTFTGSDSAPTVTPVVPGPVVTADPAVSNPAIGSPVTGSPTAAPARPAAILSPSAVPSGAVPARGPSAGSSGAVPVRGRSATARSDAGRQTAPEAGSETARVMPIPSTADLWNGLDGHGASLLLPATTGSDPRDGSHVGAVLLVGGLLSLAGIAAITGKRRLAKVHQARTR